MCSLIREHENIPRPSFGDDYQRHGYPNIAISAGLPCQLYIYIRGEGGSYKAHQQYCVQRDTGVEDVAHHMLRGVLHYYVIAVWGRHQLTVKLD